MSRTSQPPRRELYLLQNQPPPCDPPKSAETQPPTEAAFLYPKPRAARLTIRGWTSGRVAIYNADYASNGERFLTLRKPWTVVSPIDFRTFHTHTEALTYAIQGETTHAV
ncbi:hypothetical protein ArV2_gp51 [Arthrobacter phage vB_ArS-ArV2]|uniref:Uncharacterized protein n=1 Tax=Arthrobacter phage vB_ArS-ArV2 TaxID=1414742 RepID=V5R9C5_9CAUD|nr:hypothetical protein ArV2_gp51 [Arthrobacter phage vB_ArS-ArV2]AHB31662.1 hypothetical protein ArV2_gp51 [Arthrobacter phage vB_ArS-ArV2]